MDGFTSLDIRLDGDGAFADWREDCQGGRVVRVAALTGGTSGGNLSVALGIIADDGSQVIAETTWRLLHTAVRAIEARYGRPT